MLEIDGIGDPNKKEAPIVIPYDSDRARPILEKGAREIDEIIKNEQKAFRTSPNDPYIVFDT